MLCCQNCFSDKTLKYIIKDEGTISTCNFCESKDIYCVPPESLGERFFSLVSLYSPVENFAATEQISNNKGKYIWDQIHDDWNVFDKNLKDKRGELFKTILSKQIAEGAFELSEFPQFYKFPREEAKKLEEDWDGFSEEMKSHNRFFPSIQIELNDLEYSLQYLEYLEHKIESKTIFFRSRKLIENKKYPPSKMGIPPAEKARNGRANPVGIPYLYLASNLETAISEIRPSLKDKVTVGRFKLLERISIIDLRNVSPFRFVEDEDFEKLFSMIGYLNKLGTDLSKPVNPKGAELEYLPTQYLCEFIKSLGFDGVAYNSSLANGHNLAIFRERKLKCTRTELYEIEKTTLLYEKCS